MTADDVDGEAEARGGVAHGVALKDAGPGDATARGWPFVDVAGDELELRREEALADGAEVGSDGAGRAISGLRDLGGGAALGEEGLEDGPLGGLEEAGAMEEHFAVVGLAASAEVGGGVVGCKWLWRCDLHDSRLRHWSARTSLFRPVLPAGKFTGR